MLRENARIGTPEEVQVIAATAANRWDVQTSAAIKNLLLDPTIKDSVRKALIDSLPVDYHLWHSTLRAHPEKLLSVAKSTETRVAILRRMNQIPIWTKAMKEAAGEILGELSKSAANPKSGDQTFESLKISVGYRISRDESVAPVPHGYKACEAAVN